MYTFCTKIKINTPNAIQYANCAKRTENVKRLVAKMTFDELVVYLSTKLFKCFVDEVKRRKKDPETTTALEQATTYINASNDNATTTGINSCNVCHSTFRTTAILFILS